MFVLMDFLLQAGSDSTCNRRSRWATCSKYNLGRWYCETRFKCVW